MHTHKTSWIVYDLFELLMSWKYFAQCLAKILSKTLPPFCLQAQNFENTNCNGVVCSSVVGASIIFWYIRQVNEFYG